jgi:hypothetical protein
MELTSVAGRTRGQAQMDCHTISRTRDRHPGIPFMKRQTDMPSKHKMQFFTPELYRRYNSPDDEIALAADAEWETAIVKYHQHLASLRKKMPPQVSELSELCLHDGEILQRQEQQLQSSTGRSKASSLSLERSESWSGPTSSWPSRCEVASLAVRLDNELVTLLYFLCNHITEQPAAKDWPFSNEREHWLYDEVHWQEGERGRFIHLILLSSGVVLAIPFVTVLISRFPLAPVSAESGKQSA